MKLDLDVQLALARIGRDEKWLEEAIAADAYVAEQQFILPRLEGGMYLNPNIRAFGFTRPEEQQVLYRCLIFREAMEVDGWNFRAYRISPSSGWCGFDLVKGSTSQPCLPPLFLCLEDLVSWCQQKGIEVQLPDRNSRKFFALKNFQPVVENVFWGK